MIKLNAKEKNIIEGLCDVVLKCTGLKFQAQVDNLLKLCVVEKQREPKKTKGKK